MRAAVGANNRTVVFDLGGTINLASPLIITNSNLTIAGQTAPGGGITVAGQMTTVANAHDVIIRDVRFRSLPGSYPVTVWENGFEEGGGLESAGDYFAGGWYVNFGSIVMLETPAFGSTAYEGVWYINLDGSSPDANGNYAGGISTNLVTIPGQAYTLNFAYARDPDSITGVGGHPAGIPSASVRINGQPLAPVTANYTNSWTNLNWQPVSYGFTASSNSTLLAIYSLDATNSITGVLLDDFSLTTNAVLLGGGLQFNTVSNVIADHVSTSWCTNSDLMVLAATNLTVQWSIMADSLYSTNSSTTNLPTGSLLGDGGGALSFHHNLYADNISGSPQLGDNLTLDFVNNVIYNWGLFSGLSDGASDANGFSPNGCTNQLNYVCNYLIAGADTAGYATNFCITNIAFFGGHTNAQFATWIYQTNNFIDSDNNGVLNGSDTGWGMFTNDYTRFGHVFSTPPVSVDEAYQAYEKVLDFAGVSLALRDPADTNIVGNVRYQTGRITSSAPILPGLNSTLPYLDTDQDGLPDFWESTFTPSLLYIPSNNHARTGDGYTDLEEYNNWLAGPHALTTVTNPVAVDLYQMCGESGHLAFFVTNGVQGFVYLTNVLGSVTNTSTLWSNTIAVFTPTNSAGTNYYGYAAFDFYVTNLDTAAWFGPVTVSVIVSAVPITINSNFPPVITPLVSGLALDPCNAGGSDFYSIVVGPNDYGALFELDSPTGPMALLLTFSNGISTLPSLSSYDYYTNQPPSPANLQIAVLTNSLPVPLQPGIWWLAAVNESGSNVCYTAKATLLGSLLPPEFIYPTNTTVTNILETVPWGVTCVAVDLDTPPLPLSFALVSGPAGLTVSTRGDRLDADRGAGRHHQLGGGERVERRVQRDEHLHHHRGSVQPAAGAAGDSDANPLRAGRRTGRDQHRHQSESAGLSADVCADHHRARVGHEPAQH